MKFLIFILSFFCIASNLNAQRYKGSTYYEQKLSFFRAMPEAKSPIIFVGNSITDGAEWRELFPNKNILNRGISGDQSEGVLERLDEIIRNKPSKVFLLIGTNDIAKGVKNEDICNNIHKIVLNLKYESPNTKIYVQSILPLNMDFDKFPGHKKRFADIDLINSILESRADILGYTFININKEFTDDRGYLKAQYTNDGLHLMGEAYLHWAKIISRYL